MSCGLTKTQKYAICGSVAIVVGVIFLAVGITLPILINKGLRSQVPVEVAVSQENEENWSEVPGDLGVNVVKWTYVYNWTNPQETLFDGEQPTFEEVGPIPYKNYMNFTDVNYTRAQIPWDNSQNERNAAFYFSDDENVVASDYHVPDYYNDYIVGVNPATVGVWHALKNVQPWQVQLGVLTAVSLDGLGNDLVTTIASEIMHGLNFGSAKAMKNALFPTDEDFTVDLDHVEVMWDDPHYGLKK